MKHRSTPEFWRLYGQLPIEVRRLADRCFEMLRNDPRHPSLSLKKIGRLWGRATHFAYAPSGEPRTQRAAGLIPAVCARRRG